MKYVIISIVSETLTDHKTDYAVHIKNETRKIGAVIRSDEFFTANV